MHVSSDVTCKVLLIIILKLTILQRNKRANNVYAMLGAMVA